jgi:hypothetical protein
MAELAEDADAAASRCDAALREVLDARASREAVSARVSALVNVVARAEPGLVPPSRMEPVARAADEALLLGGEVAPRRRAPRVSIAGPLAEEEVPA